MTSASPTTREARSQFNNAGTFHKNGGGAASFSAEFNNTGTANVNDGELTLSGGGLSTGSFIVASPAKLRFNGGTYDLDIASSISGAGTVEMSSGTVNLGGNYSLTGTTAISNGTANFNSAGNTNLLTISGGILGGSGTLTASGPLTWTGGTMTGAGITQADGGIQMSGTTKSLNAGRILNNVGSATWSEGNINSGGGGTLENQATGSFTVDATSDLSFSYNQGGAVAVQQRGYVP